MPSRHVMSHGRVSVVIPCFNHGRYLPDAIRSVQAQQYPSIELLVVDDGSTDDSAAIAARAGAIVVSQPNSGLSAARNAGLRAAAVEFVIFLDADDELLSGAVASGVAALERHPHVSCLVRQADVMDEQGHPLPATYADVRHSDLYAEWLQQNFAWTPGAAMFRRARLLEIGGFPVDVPAAADYAVYLRLARRQEVLFIPERVVRYRKHAANMSADPVLMLGATLEVLRRERAHLPPGYERAYRDGLRRWRVFYGDQIVERLRLEWRGARRARMLLAGGVFLLRHCQPTAVVHLLRKIARVVRRQPPESESCIVARP